MGANGKPSGPSTSFSSASMPRASSAGDVVGSGDGIIDSDDDGEEAGPAYAMPTSSTNIVVDVDSSCEFAAVEGDGDDGDGDDGDGDDGILLLAPPPHPPSVPPPVVGEGRRRQAVAWVWKESQFSSREESIVIEDDRRRRRHRGVVMRKMRERWICGKKERRKKSSDLFSFDEQRAFCAVVGRAKGRPLAIFAYFVSSYCHILL